MIQTDLTSFSYKKGSLVSWCKKCGAQHFYRKGKNENGIPRYQCRACGFRFVWTSDLPRRNFFSSIMSFAVELYTSPRMGASLRGVVKILRRAFAVTVSYEAVRQWVRAATRTLFPRKMVQETIWHADETYVKIKGKGFWLWIVYGANTKQVLAWHLSRKRTNDDARTLFERAQKGNGSRPEKIITDGLRQYCYAIKKAVGWNWREEKIRHVVDSGIGKNAIIERLNREVKRRLKWFSTFQSLAGAKAFFGLWFYHYNRERRAT